MNESQIKAVEAKYKVYKLDKKCSSWVIGVEANCKEWKLYSRCSRYIFKA